MKVALLGNMNNNSFSIMRYFRDLGIDAHILLFSNDGIGTLSHFSPENDTWNIDRWKPYIHQLDIQNGCSSILGNPKKMKLPPSISHLNEIIQGYDFYIGSGVAPAILGRCNRALDIFYPYGVGVEFVGCLEDVARINSHNPLKRAFYRYLRHKQIEGIRRARYCIAPERGLTKQTFDAIGKECLAWNIPMLYHKEQDHCGVLPKHLCDIKRRLGRYDFTCFSHASQTWVRDPKYSPSEWRTFAKNNHWLISGFAEFVKGSSYKNSYLVLLDYGPDVGSSKELIRELGIEGNVVWMPKMPRKELMYVLSLCDIGVGEFITNAGCIWGGTGLEVLASGKPLLQSFNFSWDGFMHTFGIAPPPILNVQSPEDVALHLRDMHDNKERRARVGQESRNWFNEHSGEGLARKWLGLLTEGYSLHSGDHHEL